MLTGHFEALRPVCPVCRAQGREPGRLAVSAVEAAEGDDVIAGIIGCPGCGAEYPILDGLPVLLPDVRRFVQDNLFYLMARDDLPPLVESLLGDAAGPGSGLEAIRQNVSSYVWDHWGDLDPQEAAPAVGGAEPGGISRLLSGGLELLDDLPEGPVLDVGSGAGRVVTELAAASGRRVLGIDISVPLARVARRAVTGGRVDYPRRRLGLAYDRRGFDVAAAPAGLADVWIADVLALPFEAGSFALATAMNVLDCLADPRGGLVEIDRVLAPGGGALFAMPFDWSGQITPFEGWIGGHSQRAPHAGDGEPLFAAMLSAGPMAVGGLRLAAPPREMPWHVRLHERSCMHYRTHVLAARREPG